MNNSATHSYLLVDSATDLIYFPTLGDSPLRFDTAKFCARHVGDLRVESVPTEVWGGYVKRMGLNDLQSHSCREGILWTSVAPVGDGKGAIVRKCVQLHANLVYWANRITESVSSDLVGYEDAILYSISLVPPEVERREQSAAYVLRDLTRMVSAMRKRRQLITKFSGALYEAAASAHSMEHTLLAEIREEATKSILELTI